MPSCSKYFARQGGVGFGSVRFGGIDARSACPYEGASARRMLRGMMVWKTWSGKYLRTSLTTSVARWVRPSIHGQDHAAHFQLGEKGRAHAGDGLGELAQPFQRQIFALHRDDDAIARGDQPVDGQQAERRRAVDQNVIVAVCRWARGHRAGGIRGAPFRSIPLPPRPGRVRRASSEIFRRGLCRICGRQQARCRSALRRCRF